MELTKKMAIMGARGAFTVGWMLGVLNKASVILYAVFSQLFWGQVAAVLIIGGLIVMTVVAPSLQNKKVRRRFVGIAIIWLAIGTSTTGYLYANKQHEVSVVEAKRDRKSKIGRIFEIISNAIPILPYL